MSQCYSSCDLNGAPGRPPQKDYSQPLHVDCSVEYELPNAAKPPQGAKVEPLLMIHPCYYRRAESQRRSPFINNLPSRGTGGTGGWRTSQVARMAPSQPPYPVRVVAQAAARAEAVMALLWPDGVPPPPPPQQQQQQQTSHHHQPATTATSTAAQQQQPYTKPVRQTASKRDPLLCGGGDFSSGSDSGISAGHWTDSDRSPLAPELRLQRDFQAGPDSGIATPVSEDKTAGRHMQHPGATTAATYVPTAATGAVGTAATPCSCGKSHCSQSFDAGKTTAVITSESQYLPQYEQTPFQTPGLSRYSQTQLQQWLHSVQVSLSPQRKRVAPAPPQMHRYGIVSPIVIH